MIVGKQDEGRRLRKLRNPLMIEAKVIGMTKRRLLLKPINLKPKKGVKKV